jgi:hypothetical protein
LQLTEQDRAIAAAIAQAHPMEPASPADDAKAVPTRTYYVKVYTADGRLIGFPVEADSGFSAAHAGKERYGLGSRVVVHPMVEQTYAEGLARYPEALHRDATPNARQGWADEAARFERALLQEMRQPGYGKLWGAS